MTEQDYIDATNLAKARIALNVIRDTIPARESEQEIKRACLQMLAGWIDCLESLVSPP